jgi:hypothetical protein
MAARERLTLARRGTEEMEEVCDERMTCALCTVGGARLPLGSPDITVKVPSLEYLEWADWVV